MAKIFFFLMFKCYRKAMILKEAVPIKSVWMAISKKQSHLKPITDFYLLFFIASSLKEIGREKIFLHHQH